LTRLGIMEYTIGTERMGRGSLFTLLLLEIS